MSESENKNRLGQETSPYLLQHKDNPVHWWPWGEAALAEARATGKPILLSIGYAACHWCHVMAHESFEDDDTAAQMNRDFINVKVDREERPDIDSIYMSALLQLSNQGGWPLTMFLDGEARPFWGGTYFPPEPRFGRPSFKNVLTEIARIYRDEPDKVKHNAGLITQNLSATSQIAGEVHLSHNDLADLARSTIDITDPVFGGIKGAPKFPQWNLFWFFWRAGIAYDIAEARQAVTTLLTNVCQGGIFDHLGGGFARYSVDEHWLVPHFEKMLYDNGLLLDLLTEVYRDSADPLYARRIRETIQWIEREMIGEGGGLAASLDADSEGEEGKYYVWSKDEITAVLGAQDGQYFCDLYDITEAGNFEGKNIPNRLQTKDLRSSEEEDRLAVLREKLLTARANRIRPGWDDKILADWNGLAITALAQAATVFQEPRWLEIATRAFDFVAKTMVRDGRLYHSYRAGQLSAPGTAADYANMIRAGLRLYQSTGDRTYLTQAKRWTETIDRHFWDNEHGGYATSADDTPDVIVRMRNANDDATPNANALMLANLVTLFLLGEREDGLERAQSLLNAFAGPLSKQLFGHFGLLAGYMDVLNPQHIVIATSEDDPSSNALSQIVRSVGLPGAVCEIIAPNSSTASDPAQKKPVDGKPAAYLCVGPQCSPPITAPDQLRQALMTLRRIEAV